jgi:hypothetical protein
MKTILAAILILTLSGCAVTGGVLVEQPIYVRPVNVYHHQPVYVAPVYTHPSHRGRGHGRYDQHGRRNGYYR